MFKPTAIELLPCKDDTLDAPLSQQYVNDTVFVSILFAAPIGGILIGELFIWAFTSRGLLSQLQTIVRFGGHFYFGFLLTSIITDSIGYFIVKPTPIFYTDCLSDKCSQPWINITECHQEINDNEYNHYFRSFPNYRSAVSAYTAVYYAWYLNVAFKARINNTICPLITAGCVILCLFASLSDLTAHEAYWEDIVVGWFMGVCTAIYMVVVVDFFAEKHKHQPESADTIRSVKNTSATLGALPRVQAINKGFNNHMLIPAERNYHLTLPPADGLRPINNSTPKNSRILAYETSTF